MSVQSMEALAKANTVKAERAIVRRRLAAREITLGEALAAPCCAKASLSYILQSQYRYGRRRMLVALRTAGELCKSPPPHEMKLVRDLTDRQREALIQACEGEVLAANE